MDVRFRSVEYHDLDKLRDWRNEDETRYRTREHRLLNWENQKDWLDWMSRDDKTLMYKILAPFPTDDERFFYVGICGLTHIDWKDRHAELSLLIGPEKWRRKGIGHHSVGKLLTIAFDELGLNSVWAEVYTFNRPMIGLLEKAGFRLDGRLRSHVWAYGAWYDSLLYTFVQGDAYVFPKEADAWSSTDLSPS